MTRKTQGTFSCTMHSHMGPSPRHKGKNHVSTACSISLVGKVDFLTFSFGTVFCWNFICPLWDVYLMTIRHTESSEIETNELCFPKVGLYTSVLHLVTPKCIQIANSRISCQFYLYLYPKVFLTLINFSCLLIHRLWVKSIFVIVSNFSFYCILKYFYYILLQYLMCKCFSEWFRKL